MGQSLYDRSPAARAVFDRADDLLGFSLSTLCFQGPEAQLTDTANQQPALFVTSLAARAALIASDDSEPPAFMAGHSLGELTALVASGSIGFGDGLSLVRQRGLLMKGAGEQEPGAMAAILALDTAVVADICAQVRADTGRRVQIANDNCPGQLVISGDKDALAVAMTAAKEAGARKVVQLPITIASHSPLMAGAAEAFAAAVAETAVAAPGVPVIGNVSARPLATPADVRHELEAQLTSPVRWTESIQYLLAQGVDTFVEVGPKDVLLSLVKRIDRKAKRIKLEV